MKFRTLFLCLTLIIINTTIPAAADQCTSRCQSIDPVEVAECLLECEG
jgi:hypothetical protein